MIPTPSELFRVASDDPESMLLWIEQNMMLIAIVGGAAVFLLTFVIVFCFRKWFGKGRKQKEFGSAVWADPKKLRASGRITREL